MKSDDPVITTLLVEALMNSFGERSAAEVTRFRSHGWTSESLEALVDFINKNETWRQSDIRTAFRAYNMVEEDFTLLARTFLTAREHLADQGNNLHTVYSARRREMPGSGS
jgi:hypothetical protein